MSNGPIRSLRFVHTAIRTSTAELADRSAALDNPDEAGGLLEELELLSRALKGHALGEDEGYFPTLEERAPGLVKRFSDDHAHEADELDRLVDAVKTCSSAAELQTVKEGLARLRADSDDHLDREETELWPATEAHFSPPEQGAIMGAILAVIPKPEFPVLIPWITARNPDDEAVAYVELLQRMQPPEVFEMTRGWLKNGLPEQKWQLLTGRVPGLA